MVLKSLHGLGIRRDGHQPENLRRAPRSAQALIKSLKEIRQCRGRHGQMHGVERKPKPPRALGHQPSELPVAHGTLVQGEPGLLPQFCGQATLGINEAALVSVAHFDSPADAVEFPGIDGCRRIFAQHRLAISRDEKSPTATTRHQ